MALLDWSTPIQSPLQADCNEYGGHVASTSFLVKAVVPMGCPYIQ